MLRKESLVFIWYVILLIIGILLGESFSSYNYIYAASAFAVLLVVGVWKRQYIRYINILVVLFTAILVYSRFHNTGYYILDSLHIIVFFILLSTVFNRISKDTITKSYYLFALYIVAYFAAYLLGINKHEETQRYLGLMGGVNLSCSILLFMMCFVCEYLRLNKKLSLFNWGLLLIAYAGMVFITSTRSLLFAVPYWLYSFTYLGEKKSTSKKIIISILFLGILALVFVGTNMESVEDTLRLSADDRSFQTRDFMQLFVFEKILSNYFILPSGFHDSLESLSAYMGEKHPAHNDILSYWNEWGIAFPIFILFFIKSLKKINLRTIFFLIMYVGACLHNLMFSMPLLFPFFMVLNLGFFSEQDYDRRYLQGFDTRKDRKTSIKNVNSDETKR